jgi:hypothetical protein
MDLRGPTPGRIAIHKCSFLWARVADARGKTQNSLGTILVPSQCMRRSNTVIFLGAVLGVCLVGCADGGEAPPGETVSASEGVDGGPAPIGQPMASNSRDPGAATPCVSADAATLDPATLPACAPACGGAHCVPSSSVPAESSALFATCHGGYCVPDTLLASGGDKPPSCASAGGAAGVCMSVCVPEVAQNEASLPQATCATDERCAPCVDPLTGATTGICDLGGMAPAPKCGVDAGHADASPTPAPQVDAAPPTLSCPYKGPALIDPSMLPACGGANSGAHCLPSSDVKPAMASEFATCPTGYCVPDKVIETGGNFIPATCTSLGGSEGRCENTVLPAVASQTELTVSSCDADELCVPCYNLLTQVDTGACHTSCDPGPAQPPTTLPSCCGGQATCVPPSLVSSADQPFLTAAGCSGGELCAPNENLAATFAPEPCEDVYFSITWYTGVCLSNCLVLPDASDLYQGSCDGLHTCVPCIDPNSGAPTGAPGC